MNVAAGMEFGTRCAAKIDENFCGSCSIFDSAGAIFTFMRMSDTLPEAVRAYYPFASHYATLPNGHQIHYVDEGVENLTLFLHDIPLWSFFFRNLILSLRNQFRCLAFDYLGFGFSDKPDGYPYSLRTISQNAIDFLKKMNVGKFSLVLHGWGAVPGMVIAQRWPERVNRIVLLNGSCFPDFFPPFSYSFYTTGILGKLLIDCFNLPVLGAAFSTAIGSYSRKGYRWPYRHRHDRVPMRIFIENLPYAWNEEDRSWLEEIVGRMPILTHKKFLALWGTRDKMFQHTLLGQWKEELDNFATHEFPASGRNALEDEFDTMLPLIRRFLIAGLEPKIPQL
ncbi:MAG: alpha/beta fold hydrolase [Puniceicoccales bacterium]|jgi:haloalkane dehalogenase|nr:alpha/beta fold hydrolase [Puniceicoccales bacterium]